MKSDIFCGDETSIPSLKNDIFVFSSRLLLGLLKWYEWSRLGRLEVSAVVPHIMIGPTKLRLGLFLDLVAITRYLHP